MIPAILGITFMIILGFGMVGFIAMMVGSVLSGLIGALTMGKNTSRQEKLSEDILDLQLKYQNKYKCPKCGKQYSLDLHWKKLQADGKCPFACGARFV
jgi:DNA-directed RNA polymerase subunit RPC12/RpoP